MCPIDFWQYKLQQSDAASFRLQEIQNVWKINQIKNIAQNWKSWKKNYLEKEQNLKKETATNRQENERNQICLKRMKREKNQQIFQKINLISIKKAIFVIMFYRSSSV